MNILKRYIFSSHYRQTILTSYLNQTGNPVASLIQTHKSLKFIPVSSFCLNIFNRFNIKINKFSPITCNRLRETKYKWITECEGSYSRILSAFLSIAFVALVNFKKVSAQYDNRALEESFEDLLSEEKNSENFPIDGERENSENITESKPASAVGDTEENEDEIKSAFMPVVPDELTVTDPVEFNDAASLTYQHIVQQSSAIALEAALQLTMRASRAYLQAAKAYCGSLGHTLDLLQYQETLAQKASEGVVYEEMVGGITEALVVSRAQCHNNKKQYKDLQLLVGLSAQSVEALTVCCHVAGTECTALASAAAINAIKLEVEKMEVEVRKLERGLKEQEANLIKQEKETHEKKRNKREQEESVDKKESIIDV